MKRDVYTLKQARRVKKIDNVIFTGELMKEIVDELCRMKKK